MQHKKLYKSTFLTLICFLQPIYYWTMILKVNTKIPCLIKLKLT